MLFFFLPFVFRQTQFNEFMFYSITCCKSKWPRLVCDKDAWSRLNMTIKFFDAQLSALRPRPQGTQQGPSATGREGLVMLVLTSELVILVPEVQSRQGLQEKRGITWKLWMECHLWGAFSWRRVLWLRGSWHCRICPGHSMCAMRKGSGCQERCPESPVASPTPIGSPIGSF